MKGKRVIIPEELQYQATEQSHINQKGVKNTRVLARDSVYWVNMNSDTEIAIKNCKVCLVFQYTAYILRSFHTSTPCKETGTYLFQINNQKYFCIVDYFGKFSIVR